MTDRQQRKAAAELKAPEVWAAFTDSEKHGVRFGMFPAGPMAAAEATGVDGHALTVALMTIAELQAIGAASRAVQATKGGRR